MRAYICGPEAVEAIAAMEAVMRDDWRVHVEAEEPAATTIGSRDPDGLLAENAMERQRRWFER